jgi:hypothetical protein
VQRSKQCSGGLIKFLRPAIRCYFVQRCDFLFAARRSIPIIPHPTRPASTPERSTPALPCPCLVRRNWPCPCPALARSWPLHSSTNHNHPSTANHHKSSTIPTSKVHHSDHTQISEVQAILLLLPYLESLLYLQVRTYEVIISVLWNPRWFCTPEKRRQFCTLFSQLINSRSTP